LSNYGTKEAKEVICYLDLLQIEAAVLRELRIKFLCLQNVHHSFELLSLRKCL